MYRLCIGRDEWQTLYEGMTTDSRQPMETLDTVLRSLSLICLLCLLEGGQVVNFAVSGLMVVAIDAIVSAAVPGVS